MIDPNVGRIGFPGLYRPGLIEAPSPGVDADADERGFPGLYRPGLIEASLWPELSCIINAGFRGFTAPASLKHIGWRYRGRGAGRVSGALPPRPH